MKKDKCVILSTQHLEEAEAIADQVCIMSRGKIEVEGTPDEIKKAAGVGYNIHITVPKNRFSLKATIAEELRNY